MDDNAEKLARQKMRSDAMKRQFAINGMATFTDICTSDPSRPFDPDYKRTQKVLASCKFCFGEDDSLPKAPIIAMGTRVYLALTQSEPLVEGHCLIVPIQHHLSMLEGDDDVWDEVRVRVARVVPRSIHIHTRPCLAELHEERYADVRRTRQGCRLL